MACSSSSANVSTVAPSSDDYCGSSSSSLLERLIDDAPDIFQHEVLPKVYLSYYGTVKNGTALTLLRRVSRKCKAAVEAAGQPIAGFSEGVAFRCRPFYATVELFEWARANGMPLNWRASYHAATQGGGVEVLAKAREHGYEWNAIAFDWVAMSGNLEVLKYMHEEGCPWNQDWREEEAMDHAATSGNVEMVRWLRSVGAKWGEYTFPGAAEDGGVALLEFLWEQLQGGEDVKFESATVIGWACMGEDVESVKWCLKHGCELSAWCLADAAQLSSLDMIKFLREDLRCPWDESTCACAAENDRLDILQWVRARGCPWDATTMMRAAMLGHMEILKWARANDAPWDKRACEWAAGGGSRADGGSLEALMWLVENGCPLDYHDARVVAERSRTARYHPTERFEQILSWLDENFAD